MPITPLHIGIPGLAAHYFRRHINLTGAVIGSVIVDLDFFLFLLLKSPIHGPLHTFFGAAILAMIVVSMIGLRKKWFNKIENLFHFDTSFDFYPLNAGAFMGTFSHILLDSMIYNDMKPLWPLKENYFYLGGSTTVFIMVYMITALTTIALLVLIIQKSTSHHPGP